MLRISTLIIILLFGVLGANAAILTVTTTADSGVGSLRQAISDGITNGDATDIVFAIPTIDPGYDLGTNRFTIQLASTLPTIPVSAFTITNTQLQGVTVKGDDLNFRILSLVNSAVVVITNITISHGFVNGNGGGIYMGDSGTLTLNDCNISNNASTGLGGGIYMSNSGTLHVFRTTFASNSAMYGGAIFPFVSGTVNLSASTLSGNTASDSGGAIYMESASTLNATNNTFSGNTAANDGGAILNQATITLISNTITGNSATYGGGICNYTPAATLNNNIIAGNSAGNGTDLQGDNDIGIAYTGTYNLIGNIDGSVGLATPTNLRGNTATPLDPSIGPLQSNGGPTFTHAPVTGSPVIDKGNAPGLITDQRGRVRPFDNTGIVNSGDGSDIGSVEYQLGPLTADASISGRIVVSDGKTISGVGSATITVTGPNGQRWTARSNSFGNFELTEIPTGATYSVTVTHKRYSFDGHPVTVNDDVRDLVIYAN